MRDEPEMGDRKGCILRVNDHHHAEPGTAEPGRDEGVYRRTRKSSLGRRGAGGGLWLHRARVEGAAVSSDQQRQAKPPYRRHFPRRYTAEDIGLRAAVDAAHEDLSGPAVRRILEREYQIFGKAEHERVAEISVSHIYNLRCSES